MFGGGVEAGKPDETLPIRGTAIRGHLRYWWRATIGYRLGNNMWQREEEVFGSTEFPSPVTVVVFDRPGLQLVDPSYGDRFGPIAYALFSAIENQQQVVKEGVSWRLHLSWDGAAGLETRRRAQNAHRRKDRKPPLADTIEDITADLDSAFKAWCAFGGLGARTRRGCGAVHCTSIAPELPDLLGKVLVGRPQSNALEAWKEAVKVYRDFRQSPRGRKHGKTINTKNGPRTIQVPGRSHWPEADSIRKITGCALKAPSGTSSSGVPADEDPNDHSSPVVPEGMLPAFPKATLGLPINFHFADGPGKNRPGQATKDPQDVQLVPLLPGPCGSLERADRLASPVITRPLWLGGTWCPAVIVLDQSLAGGFQVRLEGKHALAGGADLSCDLPFRRVVGASLGDLRPMRGRSSALEALTDFLTSQAGFREVTR
jgi:CRISPR-associated protein Cmr1